MNTKPNEILEIEYKYEKEFFPMDEKFSLSDNVNANTFQLNDQNEVIGLNMINNGISEISILQNFKNIKILILRGNEIKDLSFLKNLENIYFLDLSHNQIIDISGLKNLKNLKFLDLNHNKIIDISILGSFFELTSLNLWNNQISDISVVKRLTKINSLTLWSNNISDISALKDLKGLKLLDLDSNNVSDISALSGLISLNTLYLSNTLISDISPLKSLINLTNLNLSNNNILTINDLEFMPSLRRLTLSAVKVVDSDYRVFTRIKSKLESLTISNCQISNIFFLKNLTSLISLDLSFNLISDISNLENLINLKEIDLQSNNISDIKPILRLIKDNIYLNINNPSRSGIKINNNPLKNPPLEVLEQGNDAVIRFFNKIDKEGIEKIYEAKVTFVGQGSAGKTSLIKRLLNSKSDLPKDGERTRGIVIEDWEFKKQTTKIKHIAHIWDFGGQDVYYPVHRFFLTENSVFVLLASSRLNEHNFDYWIPTIFQFGGKSPIILGQTCHDGNTVHWNDIGLYIANDNFNIIKDHSLNYHEINLPKNNRGLVNIKKSIVNQILNLPHYKKNVPKSWIQVRELVEKIKKKNCISFLDLKREIQNINLESFSTKEDVEDCIKFFHSIGLLLWYHNEDKLRDWVVLNPKWAVDAVYKIIDYKKNTNEGIILAKDFDVVWKTKMYDDKHDILKQMLEVFKIAFPKKTNKTDYIMPTRLDSIPIEKIWNEKESCLRLVYNYEFMPKGLVNQISAELSRYITADDEVWNNAVNFVDSDTTSQVLEKFYDREIIVKAKGSDARAVIKLIMNAIDDVTDGYKGVKSKISIPCVCLDCLKSSEPTTFKYEMLLEKIKNKKDKVTCNISDETFRIEELLFNIGLPNESIMKKNSELDVKIESKKSVKVFVTYSWTDENGVFDSEHQKRVGKLSNQLRKEWNIDSHFDLQNDESNFVKMMFDNLHRNDKIIIVLSKGYAKKANEILNSGVRTEYDRIINDIQENPKKYILISFENRSNDLYPFGLKGMDTIVIKNSLVSENLPSEQNRLLSKLLDDPIVDIPELGGKIPKVQKTFF